MYCSKNIQHHLRNNDDSSLVTLIPYYIQTHAHSEAWCESLFLFSLESIQFPPPEMNNIHQIIYHKQHTTKIFLLFCFSFGYFCFPFHYWLFAAIFSFISLLFVLKMNLFGCDRQHRQKLNCTLHTQVLFDHQMTSRETNTKRKRTITTNFNIQQSNFFAVQPERK